LNKFLIQRHYCSKMLSESSEYEDNEFEDDFDDDSDETEEAED